MTHHITKKTIPNHPRCDTQSILLFPHFAYAKRPQDIISHVRNSLELARARPRQHCRNHLPVNHLEHHANAAVIRSRGLKVRERWTLHKDSIRHHTITAPLSNHVVRPYDEPTPRLPAVELGFLDPHRAL